MSQPFPPSSRYARIETATWIAPDGRTIVYLRRRFVPAPADLGTAGEHVVVQGDRADTIAAQHIGDPEQFWRVCDGNGVLSPAEVTEVIGRRIRIPLPEGIPGGGDHE
jgi:hypothetical protein